MVRAGGLRHGEAEGATAPRGRVFGQGPNDRKPLGIAQRVQHRGQLDLLRRGVIQGHSTSIRRSSYFCYDDRRTSERGTCYGMNPIDLSRAYVRRDGNALLLLVCLAQFM